MGNVVDNNTSKPVHVTVDTTEEFVLNYGALPPEMAGWRCYRLEYFAPGHMYDIWETHLYVPPMFDRDKLEELFESCQK